MTNTATAGATQAPAGRPTTQHTPARSTTMSTNLPAQYEPNVLAAQMEYAKALAASSLLPRQYQGQPANLLWAISYGQTLGVDPMTAVQSIHVINGKPTASADLIAGLVRRAGHKLRVTGDDRKAVAQIIRADDPDFTFEVAWTIERAQAAKLTGKDTWKSFPAAMLKARAITEVARAACSEILQGTIYTPEELGAVVDQDGNPVDAPVQPLRSVQATPTEQPRIESPGTDPEAQALATRATAAKTRDEVNALAAEAKETVPPDAGITAPDTGQPDTLRAYLGRRWKALPKPAADDGDVVEGEIVPDAPADEHAAAEQELRAFAAEQGIDDIDRDAEGALGLPLAEAKADAIRGLLAQLRGNAA